VYGVNAVFILRKDCISWKKRLADAKTAVGPCQEELKLRVSGLHGLLPKSSQPPLRLDDESFL
jgi:hypothetical protein